MTGLVISHWLGWKMTALLILAGVVVMIAAGLYRAWFGQRGSQ